MALRCGVAGRTRNYATTAAAWTTATASKIFAKDAVHFVHVAVFGVLLLGMAEYLARYANAAQFNETGTKPVAGVVFAALLSAAREACSQRRATATSRGDEAASPATT